MVHHSSCNCGQLSLKYHGTIIKSSICHCYACQKRTGSVFGAQVRLERSKAEIEGKSSIYNYVGDEGGKASMHFCPTCGSTVFWEYQGVPESLIAAVGNFADKDFPAPTFSVYEDRKHSWVSLPDTITEHLA